METITLDQALDTVMQLPKDEQEMLLEIIRRRHIEVRRREIADDAQTARAAFKAGKLPAQSADAVIAELRQTVSDESPQ